MRRLKLFFVLSLFTLLMLFMLTPLINRIYYRFENNNTKNQVSNLQINIITCHREYDSRNILEELINQVEAEMVRNHDQIRIKFNICNSEEIPENHTNLKKLKKQKTGISGNHTFSISNLHLKRYTNRNKLPFFNSTDWDKRIETILKKDSRFIKKLPSWKQKHELSKRKIEQKMRWDYGACLAGNLENENKNDKNTNITHVLMLEDDILLHSSFFPTIQSFINDYQNSFSYLKLYHCPNSFLNFINFIHLHCNQILVVLLIFFIIILFIRILSSLLASKNQNQSKKSLNSIDFTNRATQGPIFVSILFIFYFIVRFSSSKNLDYYFFKNQFLKRVVQETASSTTTTILPYHQILKTRAFRYCSPAVLYTKDAAVEFSRILVEYDGYPLPYDELLWEYDLKNMLGFRKVGMMLQPNLVIHGFARSTKVGQNF